LVRGYGEGVASGSLNLFQYFSYIITIALYATGFAAYAVTFIHLPSKVWAVVVVLTFTAINFLGNRLMGRAESVIVIIKVPGPVLWRSSPGQASCSLATRALA
jgi:amino acid transporter